MLIDYYFFGEGRLKSLKILKNIYPTYSIKRSILFLINFLNQIGPKIKPDSKVLKDLYKKKRLPELHQTYSRAVLTHKKNQKNRIYVFDFNSDDELSSVTKVATNNIASAGLIREKIFLEKVYLNTSFNVPKIISFKKWNSGAALQISATPHNFYPHSKEINLPESLYSELKIICEVDKKSQSPLIEVFSKFDMANKELNKKAIKVLNMIPKNYLIKCGTCHGDLGSENIFSCNDASAPNDFFIIDWEYFSNYAPEHTDRVAVWLGARHKKIKALYRPNPKKLVEEFFSDFSAVNGGIASAIIAVIYLALNDIDLATYMLSNLDEEYLLGVF